MLSYPISSALIGIGTIEEAQQAMGQNMQESKDIPSFEQVLETLEKQFSPIPCDRCQRCFCPYGTDISTVFRQYQYYFLGKDYWALRKLNMGIEESARLCRICTEMPCLKQCPRKIRIPDEMEKVVNLVRKHPILWNG